MIGDTINPLCCGCGACANVCPVSCITMEQDSEGFDYPAVNHTVCTECGLCEKVCQYRFPFSPAENPAVYAVKHHDDVIRLASSSGGAFSLLSEVILQEGGVVFGACWDRTWLVEHTYTDALDGISAFRGSKYLQSRIKKTYREAKVFLDTGRKVLFSGTPCQIAGLNHFLCREYDNLLTVDFECHGVPSPKIFHLCINECLQREHLEMSTIMSIEFRNKMPPYCWHNFGFVVKCWSGQTVKNVSNAFCQNVYGRGFLNHLFLRPSCHHCSVKGLKSGSDITLGDFWGIENVLPEITDKKGVSLVLTNTKRGDKALKECAKNGDITECGNFPKVLKYSPWIMNSAPASSSRSLFFQSMLEKRDKGISELILKMLPRLSRKAKARRFFSQWAHRLGIHGFVKRVTKGFI